MPPAWLPGAAVAGRGHARWSSSDPLPTRTGRLEGAAETSAAGTVYWWMDKCRRRIGELDANDLASAYTAAAGRSPRPGGGHRLQVRKGSE